MKRSVIAFGASFVALSSAPSLAIGTTGSDKSAPIAVSEPDLNPVAEAKMAQDVREALAKEQGLSSKAKSLKVSTSNGRVTLSGSVLSEQERARVETLARQKAGDKVTMDVAVE